MVRSLLSFGFVLLLAGCVTAGFVQKVDLPKSITESTTTYGTTTPAAGTGLANGTTPAARTTKARSKGVSRPRATRSPPGSVKNLRKSLPNCPVNIIPKGGSGKVPENSLHKRVYFKLWSRSVKIPEIKIFENNVLKFQNFDPKKNTAILIHGYFNRTPDYTEYFFTSLREGLLSKGDYNIIGIDWLTAFEALTFQQAENEVPVIAKHVAAGIADLQEINPCDNLSRSACTKPEFLMIGQELGGYMAGAVGTFLKRKMDKVMGLAPTYSSKNSKYCISRNTGSLVEIIYTALCRSSKTSECHRAFFINEGLFPQPNCINDKNGLCSIDSALSYYVTSMTNATAKIEGELCPTYDEFVDEICDAYPTLPLYNNQTLKQANSGNYYYGVRT